MFLSFPSCTDFWPVNIVSIPISILYIFKGCTGSYCCKKTLVRLDVFPSFYLHYHYWPEGKKGADCVEGHQADDLYFEKTPTKLMCILLTRLYINHHLSAC